MSHIILSVFSTAPSANRWRYAVSRGLVTSSAAAWPALIKQTRRVQFGWVSDISWCWDDSGSIERACTCIAQHCLNRKLDYERGDTFLCRPVPSCLNPSFLSSAAKTSQLLQKIVTVVPNLSYELLMNHRRLALEGKIRAACALLSISWDVLRDVLWCLIHEDRRQFSWLLQWRSSNAHRFEKYSAWIKQQENEEGKTGIVEGWAILESCVQLREGLRSFRWITQRWCGSQWDWVCLCVDSG